MSAEMRFWMRVEFGPSCWEWTGFINPGGYGRLSFQGRKALAHRVAYVLFNGPIRDGLPLDHTCRNKPCVNPAHLEVVDQEENNRRQGAAITHCPRGHEYTEANTYYGPHRRCRACHRQEVSLAERREQIEFDNEEDYAILNRDAADEDRAAVRRYYGP